MFDLNFTITPAINSRIAQIEKIKTIIDQANILPELEVQLRFRATVEAVHSSTSIEGNPLNLQEVQKVLQGTTINAPDYAIKEVINYKQALDWLNQPKKNREILTTKDILQLHKLVMQGLFPAQKVGAWRPGPVYVVDEVDDVDIVQYTGPDAKDVPTLVESFVQWMSKQQKTQLHPVLLAGLVHYIFVSIHPFSDGNGRTTRLLVYHYLKTVNYDLSGSLSLDGYYLQNRDQYYEALSRGKDLASRMKADITPFLDFFVRGFLESAQRLAGYIKSGRVLTKLDKPLRLSPDELNLLDYIYQFGSINVAEAVDVLSATKRTTQRRLMGLVDKQVLTITGKGPATQYVLVVKKR